MLGVDVEVHSGATSKFAAFVPGDADACHQYLFAVGCLNNN